MTEITYTLLSDGSSDKALLPIIDWTFHQHFPRLIVQSQWADLSRLPKPPLTGKLDERIRQALYFYPCDYLFVHRDAEKQAWDERYQEVNDTFKQLISQIADTQLRCVIPVRMTEAWLLFSEQAIRRAAGNPSGSQSLLLPALHQIELMPNPKQDLHHLLREASGRKGRNLQKFKVSQAVQLVADYTKDFSQLRGLEAFNRFEESIKALAIVAK